MTTSQWLYDPNRKLHYWIDYANSDYVYADNSRVSFRPAPSNTSASQTTPRTVHKGHQGNFPGYGTSAYAPDFGESATKSQQATSSTEREATVGLDRLTLSSHDETPKYGYSTGAGGALGGYDTSSVAGTIGSEAGTSSSPWQQDTERTFTDPDLAKLGFWASGKVSGVVPDQKGLFPGYRVQRSPKKFFVVGKVFKVLWPELAGQRADSITITSETRFGEGIATKIRWFVVVREGNNFCTCLPINTYKGQGVAKKGVIKSNHAIVFSSRQEPNPDKDELPGPSEGDPMKPGIRVVPSKRGEKVHAKSRLDFARMYTVEHNVKVYEFGDVHRDSNRRLVTQWLYIIQHGAVSTAGVLPSTAEVAEDSSSSEESSDEEADDDDSSDDENDDDDSNNQQQGGTSSGRGGGQSRGGQGGGDKGGKGKAPAQPQGSSSKQGKRPASSSQSRHGR